MMLAGWWVAAGASCFVEEMILYRRLISGSAFEQYDVEFESSDRYEEGLFERFNKEPGIKNYCTIS